MPGAGDKRPDLIVWPESAYSGTLGELMVDGPLTQPEDIPLSDDEFLDAVRARQIAVDETAAGGETVAHEKSLHDQPGTLAVIASRIACGGSGAGNRDGGAANITMVSRKGNSKAER